MNYDRERTTLPALVGISVLCLLLAACNDDTSNKKRTLERDDASAVDESDDDHSGAAGAPSDDPPTKQETAKPDEPKPDEPKPDEPKADEPKADEPKADQPKADEPKADQPKPPEEKPSESEPKPEPEPVTPPKPVDALYALQVLVFGPDSTTTYVSLFDSLDVSKIDLTQAREFAGAADIATHGGKVFVSDGEKPTITRFSVGADGKLKEDGTVNFASRAEGVYLRDNVFISDTKAYIGSDAGYFIWNPSRMEITGEIKVKVLEGDRDGMIADGAPGILRGERVYKSYYWEDWATYTFSKEQYIVTFDTKTDTVVSAVAEERCPNLGGPAQIDEDGNVYFSNWFYNVPGTLMKGAPHSCALRIPKGTDAIDPNWILRFDQVSGGHEGAQLHYISKGVGVFSVFHEEDFQITAETEPYDIPAAVNWEAWSVDLKDPTKAQPITGMERSIADQNVFVLDGRAFILAPGKDWEKSTVYELLPDSKTRKAFEINGWSRGFYKVK